jgi:glutathione S-transferase
MRAGDAKRLLPAADRKAMTADFVLYGSPHSQFTYKIALMLRLSGQRFTFRYVSFQRGMHRDPEFLSRSRWGQVPVLVHGERALVQSGAILEYLADVLGTFRGRDQQARQTIREWLYWDTDRLGPPVYGCYGVRLGELKLLPINVDPVVAAHYRQGVEAALRSLDDQLAGGNFLVGTEPSIADLACYGDVAFAKLSGIDITSWPNVTGWAGRIEALIGFALPLDLLPMADTTVGE